MSKRLTALDGLRGFAALSVVISHIGFNARAFIDSPLFFYFFRMFSAGTYSVQLFFVLSGFLIAYLYPVISSNFTFLCKRYLRIMPVYGAVVLYIWLLSVLPRYGLVGAAVVLIAVAIGVNVLWRGLERLHHRWQLVGKSIFILFVSLQLVFMVASVTVLPAVLAGTIVPLPEWLRQLLVMLSNLTMTMYLQQRLVVLNGVFWSLVPEMLFYIVYPFAVVPLIALGNKWRWQWGVLLSLAMLKILFDLDTATAALYSVHAIFLSRSSGFLIGIWIGSLYRNRGALWEKVEAIFSNRYVNVMLLVLFFAALAFEWPDRFHQIRDYVKYHYLLLSVIFGLVVTAGITARSLIGRVFSTKILVFLGMISYSLYLIHPVVIDLFFASTTMRLLKGMISSQQVLMVLVAVIEILFSVAAAYVLYQLVEAQYFSTKKKPVALTKAPDTKKQQPTYTAGILPIALTSIVCTGLLFFVYAGGYSPSLVMAKHSLSSSPFLSSMVVSSSQSLTTTFVAAEPNLSVIILTMDYARDPAAVRTTATKNTQLLFRLFDQKNNLLFESYRKPQEVEGVPHFPFGFPTIIDSKGKTYRVELSLVDPDPSDQLYVYKDSGLVSQYTTIKKSSLTYVADLLLKRVIFAVSKTQFLFAVAVTVATAVSYYFTFRTKVKNGA